MRQIYKVKGMHCHSCELIIEEKVGKVTGVEKAKANTAKKSLMVEGNGWSEREIEKAVKAAGYSLGEEEGPFFSREKSDYVTFGYAAAAFLVLYLVFSVLGLSRYFNFTPQGEASLWLVFLVGLAAGISTCMAVVGGLVLGISARHAEKFPEATPAQRFRPQLFFNAGRIFFYTIFGALIGLLGEAIKLSPAWNGLLTIAIGVVMIALGIQVSGIAPGWSHVFTLPTGIARFFRIGKDREYSHTSSFMLGGATFFLPCGFTQAMQLLAVASGSPAQGAAIMGVFALGTAPGLLGVGGLAALLRKGKWSKFFYKFIAILIIVMALYNIQNGLNLIGYRGHQPTRSKEVASPVPASTGSMSISGATVFRATYSNEDPANTIKPSQFTTKVGKPVRIEIYAEEDGLGCMGTVMIPGLVNDPKYYKKGETTVLEFTPTRVGNYRMTCAMGVQSGEIIVTN